MSEPVFIPRSVRQETSWGNVNPERKTRNKIDLNPLRALIGDHAIDIKFWSELRYGE